MRTPRYSARYTGMQDGPNIMDVFKSKASTAASKIVGGAANAAAGSVNNAFQGVKIPNVNVAITKETKQMVYKGAAIVGVSLVLAAFAFRR